jgi:hypothetical protein
MLIISSTGSGPRNTKRGIVALIAASVVVLDAVTKARPRQHPARTFGPVIALLVGSTVDWRRQRRRDREPNVVPA